MKDALPMLAIAAIALAFVGIVTFGARDRQMLVPPPDAVAESFTRQLVERRYALARKYLSDDLKKQVTAEVLRARYDAVRARLGVPHTLRAELDWMGDRDATARAMVETDRGSAVLLLAFTREQGLWVVRELPTPAIAFSARAPR